MASDISELLKNSLSSTLESFLTKSTKINHIYKVDSTNFTGDYVKVNSSFEFADFSSNWSFFIPDISASYVFNLLMGDDSEGTNDINADEDSAAEIVDALKEVVSNICSALSTSINNSEFEELAGSKFTLNEAEIIDAIEYQETENLYRFTLDLDGNTIDILILFDTEIIKHIELIEKSEMEEAIVEEPESETEEVVVEEESSESETKEEVSESKTTEEVESKEETVEEEPESETKDETKTEDTEDSSEEKASKFAFLKKLTFFQIDDSLSEEEQKQIKLKKMVIVVAGLFIFVILLGVVLFFTGAFDPKELQSEETSKTQDSNLTQVPVNKKIVIKSKAKKKEIDFNISQVNVKKLNKKLSLLTKYEIIEEDIKEKEKRESLEKFALKKKEESPNLRDNQKSFIQVPPLDLNKFKSLVRESKKSSSNLSICKDSNGRTQIIIGPFYDNHVRDIILDQLSTTLKKKAKSLNLTNAEFKKLCSF